jgi:hypothetical protein
VVSRIVEEPILKVAPVQEAIKVQEQAIPEVVEITQSSVNVVVPVIIEKIEEPEEEEQYDS